MSLCPLVIRLCPLVGLHLLCLLLLLLLPDSSLCSTVATVEPLSSNVSSLAHFTVSEEANCTNECENGVAYDGGNNGTTAMGSSDSRSVKDFLQQTNHTLPSSSSSDQMKKLEDSESNTTSQTFNLSSSSLYSSTSSAQPPANRSSNQQAALSPSTPSNKPQMKHYTEVPLQPSKQPAPSSVPFGQPTQTQPAAETQSDTPLPFSKPPMSNNPPLPLPTVLQPPLHPPGEEVLVEHSPMEADNNASTSAIGTNTSMTLERGSDASTDTVRPGHGATVKSSTTVSAAVPNTTAIPPPTTPTPTTAPPPATTLKTTTPSTVTITTSTSIKKIYSSSSATQEPKAPTTEMPLVQSPSPTGTATTTTTSTLTYRGKPVVAPGTRVAMIEVAGGALTSQLVDTASLLAVLLFGLLFFLVTVAVFVTQAYESYRRKDYAQVDYLINGMYVDSGV